MFCKNCGTQIPEGAQFCKNCGTPVMTAKPDTTGEDQNKIAKPGTTSTGQTQTQSQMTGQDPNAPEPKKPKKKKKHFGRILLAILLVAVIYCGLSMKFHLGIWIPVKTAGSSEVKVTSVSESGTIYTLDQQSVKYDEETGINYVDDMVILFFYSDTSEDDINRTVDGIQGEIVASMPVIDQYQVRVSPRSFEELTKLCDELGKLDCVEEAYIDHAIKLDAETIPDDPWKKVFFFFGESWDEDKPSGSNWWQEAIHAPSAWEYNHYLDTIKIGIVDNGFDTGHEDLSGVIKKVTDNTTSERHGTHVAGIIGAIPNNKCGITGIVWNSELYTWDWELSKSQKSEEKYTGWNTTTQIFAGTTNLITTDGVKVVNLSAGKSGSLEELTRTKEAVDGEGKQASMYLQKLLAKGYDFVIVQSAGNGNANGYSVDAVYNGLFCSINAENCTTSEEVSADDIIDRIIVVGAAENKGKNKYQQAVFSNAGSRVDICAPGVDIYSTVPGGYESLQGTSMAAPIVTGVASLVWSADSALTGADVKRVVCSTENTKYAVEDNTSKKHPLTDSYRMVNAELAVKSVVEEKLKRAENSSGVLDDNPIASEKDKNAKPIQYSGSVTNPEDVVLKMFDALQKGDYERAAECLDPVTEQQIKFIGGLASSVLEMFSGEYISWGQMLLEAAGATDVEVIDCASYNLAYESDMDILSKYLPRIPGLNDLICSSADIYVKYRYQYNGEYYTEENTYHVKRYGWSGWRIKEGF